jgi:formylglycine-generating enzyme required for sulfatase activity
MRTEINISGASLGFVHVKGGTFFMGSNFSRSDRWPMVRVSLSDFHMAEYPVNQSLFLELMGFNRSLFQGQDLPVTNVSHEDAVLFCERFSERVPGRKFRLPTEAEWEWAASSGQSERYAGSNDIEEVGWYTANSDAQLKRAGLKKPNSLGIYDMSGNVWEWCSDIYRNKYASRPWPLTPTLSNPAGHNKPGNNRVLRGGCYLFDKEVCAVRTRSRRPPSGYASYVGFRMVMEA